MKPTLPVGALPLTVAVKVTRYPAWDGLAELVRAVVVAVVAATSTVTLSALAVALLSVTMTLP